jgi:putative flippase GtrA
MDAFLRSAGASTVSSIVELSTLAALHAAGVPLVIAFALVQLVGITITFTLNKYWAFGAGHTGRGIVEGTKTIAVVAGSFSLNTAMPSLGAYALGLSPFLAYAMSQVLTYACWNFPLNRWWVFPAPAPSLATAAL